MSESENISRVVKALQKVPEKKLLIIELANSIPIRNGILDPVVLADKAVEIDLAASEAKAYGTHTIMAVDSLVRLRGRDEV